MSILVSGTGEAGAFWPKPGRRNIAGEIILQLAPHEQAVGADIDNAPLGQQAGDQFLDFGINQWFTAANGNHRRVAFSRGAQAIFQAHHVLEAGGIFANPAAAGASEIAGVQRFKLQDQGEFGCAPEFVFDNVAHYLRRQCEWKSHTSGFKMDME